MNLAISVDQKQLKDVLLNVAPVRPVFIWGAPGIGKSAIVEEFAEEVGLECVSLLGSQLAPEDIIGVPQIVDGRSTSYPQSCTPTSATVPCRSSWARTCTTTTSSSGRITEPAGKGKRLS